MSHPNTLAERRICALKHSGNDWHASHKGAHSHKYSKGCASNDLQWNSPRWRYADKAERMYHVKQDHWTLLVNEWNSWKVESLTPDPWDYDAYEGDWRRLDINNMDGEYCECCGQFHEKEYWNTEHLGWSEEEYEDDMGGYSLWFDDFSRCPKASARYPYDWVVYFSPDRGEFQVCKVLEYRGSVDMADKCFRSVEAAARHCFHQNHLVACLA